MMINERLEVTLSVLSYSLCSGLLILFNKLTLHHLPYPSIIVCIQLVAALCFIGFAKVTKLLQVDPLKREYVIPYLYYIVLFSLGVFTNMKSLSMSNVETVIVFRALSPCVVAFLDVIFLGREYPSQRSWMGLSLLVLGAYLYASFDVKFQTQGISAYAWPTLYLFIIALEMAYGKKIIRSVDLKTLSGPVLYVNLLGLPPMFMFAVANGEFEKFRADRAAGEPILADGLVFLMLGCIAGTGIGYSGWWCRDKVSATSYTLIGVVNKCITILVNLLMWDQHAPVGGILSLVVCLVGGSIYQQAPLRSEKAKVLEDSVGDEEMASLVGSDDGESVTKGTTPAKRAAKSME